MVSSVLLALPLFLILSSVSATAITDLSRTVTVEMAELCPDPRPISLPASSPTSRVAKRLPSKEVSDKPPVGQMQVTQEKSKRSPKGQIAARDQLTLRRIQDIAMRSRIRQRKRAIKLLGLKVRLTSKEAVDNNGTPTVEDRRFGNSIVIWREGKRQTVPVHTDRAGDGIWNCRDCLAANYLGNTFCYICGEQGKPEFRLIPSVHWKQDTPSPTLKRTE